jgi:hypothetical protein
MRELLDRICALPGVESASVVNVLPLTEDYGIHGIGAVGKPLNIDSGAEARFIDPQYFETMRIPLIAGRALREDDSARVAVINRKMAYLLWPGENAIGREFTDNGNPPIRVCSSPLGARGEPTPLSSCETSKAVQRKGAVTAYRIRRQGASDRDYGE